MTSGKFKWDTTTNIPLVIPTSPNKEHVGKQVQVHPFDWTVHIFGLSSLETGLTAQEIEIAVDRSGSKVDIPAAAATQPPPTAGVVQPYQNQPHGVGPPYGQQMGKAENRTVIFIVLYNKGQGEMG